MTRVDFTGAYDAYGQPTIKTSLAVPRGRDYRVATSPGEPYLVTQTETVFAQRDDARRYIVDRVARSTTFEIVNGGARSLLDTHTAIRQGEFSRPVIGQTFNFYDGPAFQGLPIGQLGDFGALVRTESLVLTPTILTEAAQGTYPPPYFAAGAAPVWTAAYPIAFRTALPANAGYIYQPGGANSPYTQGYFAVTERRRYDFHDTQPTQVRGMIRATRDPLDRETTVAYDPFDLLPVLVTDPVGLTTAATYNYRVLQPNEVTDVNGNRTRVVYTPLGLPASTAVMGKTTQEAGDTEEVPGTTFAYDFLAFDERKKPVSVRAMRRIHHVTDRTAPEAERDETIITVEYSDGFGRVLQTRTQAEDIVFGDTALGDAGLPLTQADGAGQAAGRSSDTTAGTRVVVSGWQVYDNKGRVVEKYEPFFANGFTYSVPDVSELQRLQKTTTFYDPRGQVIRTMNPNGSEVRQIRGVPGTIAAPDLATPEQYEPSPWHLYTYDTNDNAGRTHPGEAISYRHHWNTPTSAVVDPLGRTIETVERNGPDPASDWFATRSTYDIRGNLLEIRDPLNRAALQMTYDLANRPLRTLHIDAGTQRVVFDAAGREIEGRDAKGALILRAFDALGRPSRVWARDRAAGLVTLRERIDYGDEANPNQEPQAREVARQANLLGRPQRHYDEAGLLAFGGYDFKGNLLEKARLVIKDDPILAVFAAASRNAWRVTAFKVDWTPPANTTFDTHAQSLLDPTRYETSATYDALNRVTTTRYPLDAAGQRKVLRPRYNRGGALARVELDGAPYVDRIDYNARGQRLLVVYGNGLMTRHAYDPRSGRLARLRSESFTSPAPLTFRPEGAALQDYAYEYDLAGNLIRLLDRTPQSGVATTPDRLDRDFAYDPLYRLLSATGRECDLPPAARPWVDAPRCADITRARAYTETYRYDPLGNLTRLQHQAPGGGFTRDFTLIPGSNRLATLKVGTDVWAFVYDASGNLLQEGVPRFYEWDQGDRMRVFRTQMRAPNSRPEDNLWSEPRSIPTTCMTLVGSGSRSSYASRVELSKSRRTSRASRFAGPDVAPKRYRTPSSTSSTAQPHCPGAHRSGIPGRPAPSIDVRAR